MPSLSWIRFRSLPVMFTAAGLAVLAVGLPAGRAADPPPAAASPSPAPAGKDGIEVEIDHAEHTRRFLEDRVRRDPEDTPALDRLASVDLQLLRLTGRYEALDRARAAARASLAAVPGEVNAGGIGAMARVEFESHHFAESRDLARQMTAAAPQRAEGFLILGDALLELGGVAEAQDTWREAGSRGAAGLEQDIRSARVALLGGHLDEARDLFTRSLELAKTMDPPATYLMVWCLVQRGQLAFGRGDWDGSEKDYLAAQALGPSHFVTREHLAELRGAQKRLDEAVTLYRQVVEQTGQRPEFEQALGDLLAFAGRAGEAKTFHEQALAGYNESVSQGNAHYYHHLAGFYCDVRPEPAEALKWARRDIELRQSAAAYDSLAWALYQNGQWVEAAEAARKGLAPGGREAHAVYHAGMILSRAGDLAEGGRLLREVPLINPRYFNSFHAHR